MQSALLAAATGALLILASSAHAQIRPPVALSEDTPFEVDGTAPVSTGIEVADAGEASLDAIMLFTPDAKEDGWLSTAWDETFYTGLVPLEAVLPAEKNRYVLGNKSLALPLYNLLAAGGKRPANLPKEADWFMTRVNTLTKLGFLRSAGALLDAVPRSQLSDAMREQQAVLAASLDDWKQACAIIEDLPEKPYRWVRLFCLSKTDQQEKLSLLLGLMEEQETPAPVWFAQIANHLQYGNKQIIDLPPKRDPLTWAMLLSLAPDALPKDTISEQWLEEEATTAQLLQLWHAHAYVPASKHLNRFVWAYRETPPENYQDEKRSLAAHSFKARDAGRALREAEGEIWAAIAPLVDRLSNTRLSKRVPDPKDALKAAAKQTGDDWRAVMRAYVLMDALDYDVKPAYWQQLGDYARGRSLNSPHRYVAPNMLKVLEQMRNPTYRTDLILTAVGLLAERSALAEQSDLTIAALVRALKDAGLEALARDVAAESLSVLVEETL